MKKAVVLMGAMLMAVAFLASVRTESASARPNYKAEFDKMYVTEGSALQKALPEGKSNCNVCHQGTKDKKTRNAYGMAVGKALGEPNVKDAPKVIEALGKAAKEKSATEGKTFGDLIKDGTLKLTPEEK